MSFILVQYANNQISIYNTNCQCAPLVDAIQTKCLKDMRRMVETKERQFTEELKKLEDKIQITLEKQAKENEETEQKRIEAEMQAQKQEEEKKQQKGPKKKEQQPAKQEEPPKQPEKQPEKQTEKQPEKQPSPRQKAAEKKEQTQQQKGQANQKTKEEEQPEERGETLEEMKEQQYKQWLKQNFKEVDLQTTNVANDRKYLISKGEEYANTILTNKMMYTLIAIDQEDETVPLLLEPSALRTLVEDKKQEKLEEELASQVQTKGKKAPDIKKKK